MDPQTICCPGDVTSAESGVSAVLRSSCHQRGRCRAGVGQDAGDGPRRAVALHSPSPPRPLLAVGDGGDVCGVGRARGNPQAVVRQFAPDQWTDRMRMTEDESQPSSSFRPRQWNLHRLGRCSSDVGRVPAPEPKELKLTVHSTQPPCCGSLIFHGGIGWDAVVIGRLSVEGGPCHC